MSIQDSSESLTAIPLAIRAIMFDDDNARPSRNKFSAARLGKSPPALDGVIAWLAGASKEKFATGFSESTQMSFSPSSSPTAHAIEMPAALVTVAHVGAPETLAALVALDSANLNIPRPPGITEVPFVVLTAKNRISETAGLNSPR